MREKQPHNHKTAPSPTNMEEKPSLLTHNDLFQDLSPEEVNELDRITTVITCPPGRVFYRPGEIGTAFFLLQTGCVQLYHLSTDGRKLITTTLEAGTCFGEMPLVGQDTYTSFAEAVEESRLSVMNKHDAENLLARKPTVALALLRVMGQRLSQLETKLIDTTFKGTSARLATLLLQLARPQEKGHIERLVVNGLSHEELADRLGVYRETVSAALRELKETGAIELGRKHIVIKAPALLEGLAASSSKGGRA
ncbi:MAG TPA: Crp/Fnr family transcriptional regulator [Ktedonosporobacter sp.]|nr:Crp/Fnr family transcriptional regulator [Ktedonosporobacter sp.]